VAFSGRVSSLFDHPSLSNLVPAAALLDPGDMITFAAASGKYVAVQDDGTLAATETDAAHATVFTISTAGEGAIALFSDSGSVVVVNGVVRGDGAVDTFAPLFLSLSMAGSILLAVGGSTYVYEAAGGSLATGSEAGLIAAMEFHGSLKCESSAEIAARLGLDLGSPLSPCEEAWAGFVWQVTGGLFLAFGLGPYMATGRPETGVLALLRTNPQVWNTLKSAARTIAASGGRIAVVATAISGLFAEIVRQGLLTTVAKFAFDLGKGFVAIWLLARAITTFFLPLAEVAELLASFSVWAYGTVTKALNLQHACGNSQGVFQTSTDSSLAL
jgi:hypothetical protein